MDLTEQPKEPIDDTSRPALVWRCRRCGEAKTQGIDHECTDEEMFNHLNEVDLHDCADEGKGFCDLEGMCPPGTRPIPKRARVWSRDDLAAAQSDIVQRQEETEYATERLGLALDYMSTDCDQRLIRSCIEKALGALRRD